MLISPQSYFSGLERLCDRLKQVGADQYSAPLDKQLVPLEITQGVYLNQVAFRNRLAALRKLSGGNLRFRPDQLSSFPRTLSIERCARSC